MLDEKHLPVKKARYLKLGESSCKLLQGLTIDEFIVRFDVDVKNRRNIDKWVKFVAKKIIKRLKLRCFKPYGIQPGEMLQL